MAKKNSIGVKVMLDKIRNAVADCATYNPEKEVLEALMAEAEGWKMRLEEIEAEENEP